MAASYLKQQFSIPHHLVPTLEDTAGPALASHRPQHRCSPAPALDTVSLSLLHSHTCIIYEANMSRFRMVKK